MYGTISKFKVKPGAWEMLQQSAERGPQPGGAGAMMILQTDADRSEVYTVAIAESEKEYRAMSESPEMHEAYLERLQWLESEPEWNDGKVVLFKHSAVPEGAQLYGSIAEMQVKQGALEALLGRDDVDPQPEGAVAVCLLQMDADPNRVFLVAISESEAAYRAYSESEASHEQYVEMTRWLEGEPTWHDGHVLEFRVIAE